MNIFDKLKGVLMGLLRTQSKTVYKIQPLSTEKMDAAQSQWLRIYSGHPTWESEKIKSVNFAKTICSVTANLTTLDIGIKIDGSKRADWLQRQIEKSLLHDARLRKWVEYGCAGGSVIFKPNGTGLDIVLPENFVVTSCDDDKHITGIIFRDTYQQADDAIFTRMEYHRKEKDGLYYIDNRAYFSKIKGELGKEVALESTIWSGLERGSIIEGVEPDKMLFGVFSMPKANNIDFDSPLGAAIFSDAEEELEALDVALSETFKEIRQSGNIELIGQELVEGPQGKIKLPDHVIKVLSGMGAEDFYQAIERPLKTTEREVGINLILNLIATKCGYSEGYFSYNSKSGIATATQVESDDRKTIQLIKDIRDALKSAIGQTIYALNVFADLYELAPAGEYEIAFNFGDITYSYDEDRARWYTMATSGMVPKWMYLMKFEGFSEEEAKEIIAEAEGTGKRGFFEREE